MFLFEFTLLEFVGFCLFVCWWGDFVLLHLCSTPLFFPCAIWVAFLEETNLTIFYGKNISRSI